MAYESFYGGRQGASFVIVKQYESIAKMLIDFGQGGSTTDIVNYGEYVMIDTGDINNRENGLLYRRGMNYQDSGTPYDPDNPESYQKNPGKGAIYVGHIVGPQGSIEDLEVGAYDPDALNKDGGIGEYGPTIENPGLVPGSENNIIRYSWVNVKNETTHYIEKYLIGFQFPYFQQIQTAETGNYQEPAIIEDHTPLDDTQPWSQQNNATWDDRPFYRNYNLKVPRGVKGDSVTDASGVPTKINAGEKIYIEADESTGSLSNPIQLTQDLDIEFQNIVKYEETKQKNYIKFKLNGDENTIRYAYIRDTGGNDGWHSGFLITQYNSNSQDTTSSWFDAGINNYIADMVVTDGSDLGFTTKGYLLIYYSDPVQRMAIKGTKRVDTYKGKGPQLNLGKVKGEPGTSPIMGRITSLNELYVQNYKTGQDLKVILRTGNSIFTQVVEDETGIHLEGLDRTLNSDLNVPFNNLINQAETRDNGYFHFKENGVDKYAYTAAIAIKPEELGGSSRYEGWLVTYDVEGPNEEIQGYDYLTTKDWYKVGIFGGGSGSEFVISDTMPILDEDGIWGSTEVITCYDLSN